MRWNRLQNLLSVSINRPDPGFTRHVEPHIQVNGDRAAIVVGDPTIDPELRGWVDKDGAITDKGMAELKVIEL